MSPGASGDGRNAMSDGLIRSPALPEDATVVVIGGGVMTSGELLIEPIREETRKRTIPPAFNCCRIVAGQLGQDAGIVGAAMLARDSDLASSPAR